MPSDPLSLDVGAVESVSRVLANASRHYYENAGGKKEAYWSPDSQEWAAAAAILEEAADKLQRKLRHDRRTRPRFR